MVANSVEEGRNKRLINKETNKNHLKNWKSQLEKRVKN